MLRGMWSFFWSGGGEPETPDTPPPGKRIFYPRAFRGRAFAGGLFRLGDDAVIGPVPRVYVPGADRSVVTVPGVDRSVVTVASFVED
jgi:hypothetical protein